MDERAYRIAQDAVHGFREDMQRTGAVSRPVEAMLAQRQQAVASWLGVAFSADQYDALAAEYARRHPYDSGVLVDISDTTRALLGQRLQDGIARGLDVTAMRGEVRGLFAGLQEWQVQRIARTEIATAARYGSTLSAQQAVDAFHLTGVTARLITTADPCPRCVDVEQWAATTHPSIADMEARMETGLHPNCLCDIGYDVPEAA